MTFRLHTFLTGLMALLLAALLALGSASANPTSGGYQLFERVASGISADIQLASLANFVPPPETASEYAIAPNRTSIETSNGALVRPADSPNYSVATEVQLPSNAYPGVSRRRHNQISNQALHEAFEANPTYAAQMENLYPGIVDGVRPGPRGAFPRDAPTPDVTWHHGTTPGQMQLVPFGQHTAPGPVQGSLHPGPNSGGGFADWGTE